MPAPIRVLIVDDSAMIRQLLSEMLAGDADFSVVGTAADPFVAREKIKELKPDVLTLDVEMPRMDGLTFLENLMRLHPMPVLMVSSLTEQGADVTFQALELGAVDFVTKPRVDVRNGLMEEAATLRAKLKAVARARVGQRARSAPAVATMAARRRYDTTDKLIAIGASTGGTEALKVVLAAMPADAPAVVIVQHIPAMFSGPFAERMNRVSAMQVMEATHGLQLRPGHVYIAPGGRHLKVQQSGARWLTVLSDEAPEHFQRPAVNILFRSVAEAAGPNAVGAVLTGMGEDGARGLLALRKAGGRTLIQDEASSVVWGMPGAACRLGAAECVLPIESVADQLLAFASSKVLKTAAIAPITP